MILNFFLLALVPVIFIYERVYKKTNDITKVEYWIAFVLYLIFTFSFLCAIGILDSGYHLVDDHEVYTIRKDLENYGFFTTLITWLDRDLDIRFRFTYYLIRIIQCILFGTNFKAWHICYTFLAGLSLYLSYVFARQMKCPRWIAYVFSILIFSGSQIAVFWRLGPQENLSTILLLSVFVGLISYGKKKSTFKLISLIVLTFFLGGSKEAFLVLLPILPLLLVFWQIREEGKKIKYRYLIRKLKENWIYASIVWVIFIVDIMIILLVVGTNKIGYAGIDFSFGIKDYLDKLIWSCTVAFRVYFLAMLIGCLFFIIPVLVSIIIEKKIETQQGYLLVSLMFFGYFMGTQFVLHAKSGMYERYLLPVTIGFCLFWIVDLYRYLEEHGRIKTVYFALVTVTLAAALFYTNIWSRGVAYAEEGENTTAFARKVAEYKQYEPVIISALEYELDASISVYLQEEYAIEEVYNVYYSGYDNGKVNDGYLPETGKESIFFEEADIYVGYPEKIETLMTERELDTQEFRRYEFDQFAVYVTKEIDN